MDTLVSSFVETIEPNREPYSIMKGHDRESASGLTSLSDIAEVTDINLVCQFFDILEYMPMKIVDVSDKEMFVAVVAWKFSDEKYRAVQCEVILSSGRRLPDCFLSESEKEYTLCCFPILRCVDDRYFVETCGIFTIDTEKMIVSRSTSIERLGVINGDDGDDDLEIYRDEENYLRFLSDEAKFVENLSEKLKMNE